MPFWQLGNELFFYVLITKNKKHRDGFLKRGYTPQKTPRSFFRNIPMFFKKDKDVFFKPSRCFLAHLIFYPLKVHFLKK